MVVFEGAMEAEVGWANAEGIADVVTSKRGEGGRGCSNAQMIEDGWNSSVDHEGECAHEPRLRRTSRTRF